MTTTKEKQFTNKGSIEWTERMSIGNCTTRAITTTIQYVWSKWRSENEYNDHGCNRMIQLDHEDNDDDAWKSTTLMALILVVVLIIMLLAVLVSTVFTLYKRNDWECSWQWRWLRWSEYEYWWSWLEALVSELFPCVWSYNDEEADSMAITMHVSHQLRTASMAIGGSLDILKEIDSNIMESVSCASCHSTLSTFTRHSMLTWERLELLRFIEQANEMILSLAVEIAEKSTTKTFLEPFTIINSSPDHDMEE
ncbi:hypothetical protein C9374_007971 [Naegleria lovaniensis]|uniref:Transmembrane protein n=1 Tax=Naegleria lovaniensis TaxID=51637 RepID=A0AA88KIF1_NAELO|nr:uncharacterized protein C9374_007971 [Naegleria lovaniensis]KAG2378823.1 hypothetical protein C9374_007971 [Naegleria lovaniensis]